MSWGQCGFCGAGSDAASIYAIQWDIDAGELARLQSLGRAEGVSEGDRHTELCPECYELATGRRPVGDHDYTKARVMRVELPGGGIELRESCGCSDIHRDGIATYYPCVGHGGDKRVYPSEISMMPKPCGCGSRHILPQEES